MKKNQVNAILVEQTNRRKKIIKYGFIISLLMFFALLFAYLFIIKNRNYYVSYKEDSKVNYKVYLKDNSFFDKSYIEQDKQYIASLINNISVDFGYSLDVLKENINYNYEYYIESSIEVKDKNTNKLLYDYNERLKDVTLKKSNRLSHVNINENVKVDYNKYNDLVKRFINFYDLDDAVSTLNIKMFVKVLGDCDEIDSNKDSVFSISMPLTEKTIGIDIQKELLDDSEEKFIVCKSNNVSSYIYLIFSIVFVGSSLYFIYKLVKYILKTRTAESIYQKELNKILNNYKSYIQKINNPFDISKYQLLTVDTFTDMLEIRDTLNQPILMSQNKNNTGVHFIIPSNTKILYIYTIKVSDIKKKMVNNEFNID